MTTADLDQCYFCESTDDLEDHHIVPQRFRGGDGRQNIVTVCHDCHWKLERLYNKDFYDALGIEDPRTSQEKHIVCDYHGCTNQATERYSLGETEKTNGGTWYRCEEHKREERENPQSDILELLREYPHRTFPPNTIAEKIGRETIMRSIDLRPLINQGLVLEYGQSVTIHPDHADTE